MITRLLLPWTLVLAAGLSPARGADAFGGREAAYVDWGVKNCEAVSTDKEHALVEQANARARDAFLEQYLKESNRLLAASAGAHGQESMCAEIKEWYGPQGSRMGDLLRWKEEPRFAGKSRPAADSPAGRKGKRASGTQ